MKGVHQIYLFAAAVLIAAFYFIQRGSEKEGSLYEVSNDGQVDWQVHDFWRGTLWAGQPALGGDAEGVLAFCDESAGAILLGERA